MLFDTDVLIHSGKGHPGAILALSRSGLRCIAVQTAMEFLQGSTSSAALKARRAFLHSAEFEIRPLTPNIGHRAMMLIEQYSLSNGLMSADALIAATALENDMMLCTGNARHFKAIKDLKLQTLKI
jgi:predicted nucleic acid-binding protein